jgi:hypothetical protein
LGANLHAVWNDFETSGENRGRIKPVFCEVGDGKSRCPSAYVIDPAL